MKKSLHFHGGEKTQLNDPRKIVNGYRKFLFLKHTLGTKVTCVYHYSSEGEVGFLCRKGGKEENKKVKKVRQFTVQKGYSLS